MNRDVVVVVVSFSCRVIIPADVNILLRDPSNPSSCRIVDRRLYASLSQSLTRYTLIRREEASRRSIPFANQRVNQIHLTLLNE